VHMRQSLTVIASCSLERRSPRCYFTSTSFVTGPGTGENPEPGALIPAPIT
jgi:hypothetical protein